MHFAIAIVLLLAGQQPAAKRPMTFVDVVSMRSAGDTAISPDGKLMLYTLSVPDWTRTHGGVAGVGEITAAPMPIAHKT